MSGLEMKYFVLKPHGDDEYAKASRKAMRAYASQIRQVNPELSQELRDWADGETPVLLEEAEDPAGHPPSQRTSRLSYQQAKRAVELFEAEWMGQDPVSLWDWAMTEAVKVLG